MLLTHSCAFPPVMVWTGRTTYLEICARVWNSWQTQYESQRVSSLRRVRPSQVRSPTRQDQLPTLDSWRNHFICGLRENCTERRLSQLYPELTLFYKTMLLLIRTGSKIQITCVVHTPRVQHILHGRLNKISAKLLLHSSTQWLV